MNIKKGIVSVLILAFLVSGVNLMSVFAGSPDYSTWVEAGEDLLKGRGTGDSTGFVNIAAYPYESWGNATYNVGVQVAAAYHGTRGLRFQRSSANSTAAVTGAMKYKSSAALEAGSVYRLSFYAKIVNAPDHTYNFPRVWLRGTGAMFSFCDSYPGVTVTGTSWAYYTTYFVTKADLSAYSDSGFQLMFDTGALAANTTIEIYFDDIALTKVVEAVGDDVIGFTPNVYIYDKANFIENYASLNSLTTGDRVFANALVVNNTNVSKTSNELPKLYIALYKDGGLYAILDGTAPDLPAHQRAYVILNRGITGIEYSSLSAVKAFVWDMESLKPLAVNEMFLNDVGME